MSVDGSKVLTALQLIGDVIDIDNTTGVVMADDDDMYMCNGLQRSLVLLLRARFMGILLNFQKQFTEHTLPRAHKKRALESLACLLDEIKATKLLGDSLTKVVNVLRAATDQHELEHDVPRVWLVCVYYAMCTLHAYM